ncbi:MAG: hypothetical protein ACP5US_11445 [Candidatus Kryptoniota bacterium]
MSASRAVGIYAEGSNLKVAEVARRKGKLAVLDLQAGKLIQRIEVGAEVGSAIGTTPEMINITQMPESQGGPQESEETNTTVLTGMLSKYQNARHSLAIAVGEPYLFYHSIEMEGKQRPEKVIAKIVEELQATRTGISAEQVTLLSTNVEGTYVGIVREHEVPIIDLVSNVRQFLGQKLGRVAHVESSDIALVNLVKNNYEIDESEISVIAYVGFETTRLIFMKGRNFFNIAPIINEGGDSFSVQNTIYSRILLGQDNFGLPRIDRVILCGECKNFDIKGFLSSLLVGANVDYLSLQNADLEGLPPGGADLVPQFAIPIATGFHAIDPGKKKYYNSDITPEYVREGQKVFKLAWHGLILAIVVFSSTLYFTYNFAKNDREIKRLRAENEIKRAQAAEVQFVRDQISRVQREFGKYTEAVSVLDSLLPHTQRWSALLESLSNSVERVGAMWLTDVHQIDENTYSISGFSIYRNRIPIFAKIYPGSVLRKVTVGDIRGKQVYNFQIDLYYSSK